MLDQLMQLLGPNGDPRQQQMMMQAIQSLMGGASGSPPQMPQGGGGMPQQRMPQGGPAQQMQELPPEPSEDEAMLAKVRDSMGEEDAPETKEGAWEGTAESGPSPSDMKYVEEHPTDEVISEFREHFGIAPPGEEKGGGKGEPPKSKSKDEDEEDEDTA